MPLERIYFIGGASGSGKSDTAKKLAQIEGANLPVVRLDEFNNALQPAFKHFHRESWQYAKSVSVEAVMQLLKANISTIVEGAGISVGKAEELRDLTNGRFYPVFCGYPSANMEDRVKSIREAGRHWLCTRTEEFCKSHVSS